MPRTLAKPTRRYRAAGQDVEVPWPLPELEPFASAAAGPASAPALLATGEAGLLGRCRGWVGGEPREAESWAVPPGLLLRVAGSRDLRIDPVSGPAVRLTDDPAASPGPLTGLDRDALLGPGLVLALALRGTWCLHASAVLGGGRVTAFLGESGSGKSTLAACLAASAAFLSVADDILPVAEGAAGVEARPRFPQLKLPADAQPGSFLPESLPLGRMCVLSTAGDEPALERLGPLQTVEALLAHTAGSRLFGPALLAGHLAFCARAAERVAAYRLTYPHCPEAPERVRQLLEGAC